MNQSVNEAVKHACELQNLLNSLSAGERMQVGEVLAQTLLKSGSLQSRSSHHNSHASDYRIKAGAFDLTIHADFDTEKPYSLDDPIHF